MTVTTRQGARQLSSVSCTGEKIDEVGKKARSKRKTSKVVRTKESLPIIPVNDCDSNDDHDHDHDASRTLKPTPWYHVFTKGDEEYNRYMSTEWGFEKRGTIPLFEKMSLEGAQSGLSWLTVLRKRDAYRRVFHGFDVHRVAAMSTEDVERIIQETDKANPRNLVVRHRGKIESVIRNAQCIQKMLQDNPDDPDSFDTFLWSFVDNRPILNRQWDGTSLKDAPTQSNESQQMSKALKSLGFQFVGPTTMYAMMQSCGMVIDHPLDSPEWHAAVQRLKERPEGYQDQTL